MMPLVSSGQAPFRSLAGAPPQFRVMFIARAVRLDRRLCAFETERVELERSETFRACSAAGEEGLRYLSSLTPRAPSARAA